MTKQKKPYVKPEFTITDLDAIYEKFDVNYDLLSLLMRREQDKEGRFHIRWGDQKIA